MDSKDLLGEGPETGGGIPGFCYLGTGPWKKASPEVEDIAIRLAERVRKLRLQAGLTQAELALGAGVTVETVARLERVLRGRASANANPSLETLSRLATALGVEIVDLLSMSSKAKAKDDRLALVMRSASQQTRRTVLKLAEVLVREQQSNGKATPRSRRPRR